MGIRKTAAGLFTLITLLSLNGSIASASTGTIGAITVNDLTPNDPPAIIPTNPLYFLTQWSWSMKRIFAPNKVLFSFDLADRQAAELLELYEVAPNQNAVLVHSLTDYRNSLFEAINALKRMKPSDLENGTIKDPDTFLNTIASNLMMHLQLVDELGVGTAVSGEQAVLLEVENQLVDAAIFVAGSLDTPDAFVLRLKTLSVAGSSDFKSLRIAEGVNVVISQLVTRPALTRPLPLLRALQSFVSAVYDSFSVNLAQVYQKSPVDALATINALNHLAGSADGRAVTLSQIASRISNAELRSAVLSLLVNQ